MDQDATERRTEEARGFVVLQGVMTAGLNQEAKETVRSVFLLFIRFDFFILFLGFFWNGNDGTILFHLFFLYDLCFFVLLTFVVLCNGEGGTCQNQMQIIT